MVPNESWDATNAFFGVLCGKGSTAITLLSLRIFLLVLKLALTLDW